MELLLALRKGHPKLAALLAEGLSCAVPAAAAFLLDLAVCSSRQRSLILVALLSFKTESLMHRACAASWLSKHAMTLMHVHHHKVVKYWSDLYRLVCKACGKQVGWGPCRMSHVPAYTMAPGTEVSAPSIL